MVVGEQRHGRLDHLDRAGDDAGAAPERRSTLFGALSALPGLTRRGLVAPACHCLARGRYGFAHTSSHRPRDRSSLAAFHLAPGLGDNARQRHWFARFRRRTCVVSRSVEMVEATMALFAFYHCNGGNLTPALVG